MIEGIFYSFLYYFVILDGQIIAQLVDELVSFRFGILILRFKEEKLIRKIKKKGFPKILPKDFQFLPCNFEYNFFIKRKPLDQIINPQSLGDYS